jgi:hypothetical protein
MFRSTLQRAPLRANTYSIVCARRCAGRMRHGHAGTRRQGCKSKSHDVSYASSQHVSSCLAVLAAWASTRA